MLVWLKHLKRSNKGAMRTTKFFTITLLLTTFIFAEPPREYTTKRTDHPPVIDGILDDDCWKTVPMTGNFRMNHPQDDHPATYDTQFGILYDNNNLYVEVRAFDPEPDTAW